MYKRNSYIAVRAVEEPFYIALCLENVVEKAHRNKKFKIKWLEKQTTTDETKGMVYSLSYDDKVVYDAIICSVSLAKYSRRKFILRNTELGKIQAASLPNLECENVVNNIIEDTANNVLIAEKNEDVLINQMEISNDIHQGTDKFSLNELNYIHHDPANKFSNKEKQEEEQQESQNILKMIEISNSGTDNEFDLNNLDCENKVSNGQENEFSNNIICDQVIDTESQKSWSDFSPSESEYVPDDSSSDTDYVLDFTETSTTTHLHASHSKKKRIVLPRMDDESTIVVNSTNITEEGKRVYDKRHSCYFCNKLVNKITRHLEKVHPKEMEVAKLLALDITDAKRKDGFLCLLRAGDYFHNCEVLSTKTGELILTRRPNNKLKSFPYTKYGPCPKCLGFFLLSNLWHHVKLNCPKNNKFASENSDTLQGVVMRRDLKGESLALLGNALNDYSGDFIKHIVTAFKNDDVSDVLKKDDLIMKFGLLLFEKYTKHQYEYIRQTMRQLGRLLLAIERITGSKKTLKESILPQNFDILIASVKHLCLSERNEIHRQDYGVPSLALKLGHSLKKCALVARGIALRMGDLKTDKLMEAFLDLMTMEWTAKVSAAALRTLKYKKMNAPELLPVTEDLLELNSHLKTVLIEATQKPNIHFNSKIWSRLAAATLCRIILFNKRRSGEASRMMLSHYASRPNWKEQSTAEMQATLSPIERNLADRLTIVEVPGKSRALTKVPILLSMDTKTAIDKLIETRTACGISINNLYVFARGNESEGYLRGHDSLRMFCEEANLQKPRLITSTKLRKYIATVVQLFDLKENEYDWLARHLGHDIRVHRQFYRLHESAVELTKVSRILLAVDQGEANQFSGKSLDEINITDLPALEESENESENGNDELHENNDGNSCVPIIEQEENQIETGSRKRDNKEGSSRLPTVARPVKKKITGLKSTKEKLQKRMWTSEEKNTVLKFFRLNIKKGIVPQKVSIEKCIQEHSEILKLRSWRDIKYCVYNEIQKINPTRKKKFAISTKD